MGFGGLFQGFRPAFDAGAAVLPWYRAGGAPAPLCAYQPKGAASYAASKVNLANPGTYDATDGAAYPTWDVTTGWTFNGSTQLLKTGVRLYQPYTLLIRVTSASSLSSSDYACGIVAVSPSVILYEILLQANNLTIFGNGSAPFAALTAPTGVLAIAGAAAYKNGTDLGLNLGGAWAYDPDPAGGCFIGARNFNGNGNGFAEEVVAAFAIYASTLSGSTVAAVSTAMAAL